LLLLNAPCENFIKSQSRRLLPEHFDCVPARASWVERSEELLFLLIVGHVNPSMSEFLLCHADAICVMNKACSLSITLSGLFLERHKRDFKAGPSDLFCRFFNTAAGLFHCRHS
jgi:hypothetical protein